MPIPVMKHIVPCPFYGAKPVWQGQWVICNNPKCEVEPAAESEEDWKMSVKMAIEEMKIGDETQ